MTRHVLALVLALTASGCASMATLDRSVHTTISTAKTLADGACDAGLKPKEQCRAFAVAVIPALQTAKTFSEGVEARNLSALPALYDALAQFRIAFTVLMPEAKQTAEQLWRLLVDIDGRMPR